MRFLRAFVALCGSITIGAARNPDAQPGDTLRSDNNRTRGVSEALFNSLDELAKVVDIAYCVGVTGVYQPFRCASWCHEFPDFELIKTWYTGPFLSDSCGYIALSHTPAPKRIIVSFRGTYSLTNAIVDLAVAPQVYVPYENATNPEDGICDECTAHSGFLTSWANTRSWILPEVFDAIQNYPDYQLVVLGHSLGGAVATFAGLEFKLRGWNPHITTFGEPRVGNQALANYIDKQFGLTNASAGSKGELVDPYPAYHRLTHVNDPIPLLPPSDLGYVSHAGEIFISTVDVPPSVNDLRICYGPADSTCISQQEESLDKLWDLSKSLPQSASESLKGVFHLNDNEQVPLQSHDTQDKSPVSPQLTRIWELILAHRDYFHRIGLCLPHLFDRPVLNDQTPQKPGAGWKWKLPWN
ncbi:hypothetical protein FQN57_007127 [Myotisia sp. PD_48]|nr:hypothetical protein FQN57_007127 [Myotisia sp. PD_48]